MIWIFDRWTNSDKNTYADCFNSGEQSVVIVLRDDGFLPTGAVSPYRCCVGEASGAQMEEKPLFADLLEVPDLWEIRMRYEYAEIWDDGIQKAKIDYASPIERHNIKRVNWMGQDGLVYKIDYYDKYGQLYYTELLDTEGGVDVRTYYAEREPILMYQPELDTYSWLQKGKPFEIFASTREFLTWFLYRYFPEDRSIISNDVKIMEMLSEVGGPSSRMNGNVLILTNSDQVEHLEKLASALPVLQFHIGARTLMSDKLHRLERYPNVTLYPGMSQQKQMEMLLKSTYYLDINHYQEIYDAVPMASRYGLLVVGFDNTLHHKDLVLPECVFQSEDPEGMIRFLETAYRDPDLLKGMVEQQRELLKK
ncbi:MAG: hypothetical protein HFG09_09805 [Oscillibacter sp.]|nr:hypothetical protein [Oscillibacter sp.]